MPVERQLVWFKRDLRVHDHAPLMQAAERGPVLGLYVWEPSLVGSDEWDPQHTHFVHDCLQELRERLRALGSELLVRVGEVVDVLGALHAQHRFAALWSHEETGTSRTWARDRAVAVWTREQGVRWIEVPQHGVVRRLRSRDGWAARWQRQMTPAALPAPTALKGWPQLGHDADLPGPHDGSLVVPRRPLTLRGGESRGQRVLTTFLEERGLTYRKDMSSPLAGWRTCSRVSPYLAWGALSIRSVWQRAAAQADVLRAARDAGQPVDARWFGALDSFESRLRWHCHFIQKLEDEPAIEFRNVNRAFDGLRDEICDPARLKAWQDGQTGYPLVDACMRAVHQAGWLNFRMRAMLASFAAYHLWLHWRQPAVWLGRQFLDFEPGIHFSQFQMQSGVTGINTVRIYSPTRQVLEQDPDGTFIRRFVPELADVPTVWLAQPHRLPTSLQVEYHCRIGIDYPTPVVDEKAAYAEAKRRIFAHRAQPEVLAEAKRVYEKHGSRRSPERRR